MLVDPKLIREVVEVYSQVCRELILKNNQVTLDQLASSAPILTEYVLYETRLRQLRTPEPATPEVIGNVSLLASATTGEQLTKWIHSTLSPSEHLGRLATWCRDTGNDMATVNSWPEAVVQRAKEIFVCS